MALKVDISELAKEIGDAFLVVLTEKHGKAFHPNREQRERLHKGIQLDLNAGHSFGEDELGQLLAGVGDKSRPGWRRIQNGLNRILEYAPRNSLSPAPTESTRPASLVTPAPTTTSAKKPVGNAPPRLRSVTTVMQANDGMASITPYLAYHRTTGRYEQVGPLPKKQSKHSDD